MAVDTSGNIYVADTVNDKILKFLADGTPVDAWNTAVNVPGQFSGPEGVSVDGNGNVYVADTGNDRIKKFSADGTLLATWGTPGTAAGKFSSPVDMAVDTFGNVYVADFGNDLIQKFFPSPRMDITVGGSGSGTVTSSPAGISCTSPQTCTSLFFPGAIVTLTADSYERHVTVMGRQLLCLYRADLPGHHEQLENLFSLLWSLVSSKPGDCNGNGIVSII